MRRALAFATLAWLAGPAAARAETLLERYESKVHLHRLASGWTFLLVEDHDAPVVSFFTYVDVGAAQEHYGITGLAHMFEHMAFKGTNKIGGKDFKAEAEAIDRVEAAFVAWKAARGKVGGSDPEQLAALEKAFRAAQEAADRFVVENEFGEIIQREGGVGLNAFTSSDQTGYFFSLPANKVELWAWLESERFLHPVYRDFYKERDVVKEERRMRTESQPTGRLVEEFLAAAFKAHPYGHPVVGHMSDLDSFTIADARAFHGRHYIPANMITAIAGDLTPASVIPILETYFGRIPAAPPAEPLRTIEPPQTGEREVRLIDTAQPFYLEGYHVPATTHADSQALDALAEVMGRGRTSRLYRDLVRDKKIASAAQAFRGFPGDKYPTLIAFLAVPTPGHKSAEMGEEIRKHLERLKEEPVSEQELRQVKSRAKVDLIRNLSSPSGFGQSLAFYQALTGDWRNLFRDVDRIDKLTAADLQRVAKEYLQPRNRTVARIVNDAGER